jgi:hypothetical protein
MSSLKSLAQPLNGPPQLAPVALPQSQPRHLSAHPLNILPNLPSLLLVALLLEHCPQQLQGGPGHPQQGRALLLQALQQVLKEALEPLPKEVRPEEDHLLVGAGYFQEEGQRWLPAPWVLQFQDPLAIEF